MVDQEQNSLHCGMDMIVVLKFCKREEFIPVVLTLGSEYADKLFQFLVHVFGLSVRLRVVCRRGCHVDAQKFIKFMHELCYELWAVIGYHILRESMELPDIVEIELHGPTSCDRGVSRHEVGPFSQGVHRDHDCVVTMCFG